MKNEMLALILAGGQGTRLGKLTQSIAKPAVQFGGRYRIIDFALSNCANSGIHNVGVVTQYQPLALNNHIGNGSSWGLDGNDPKFIDLTVRFLTYSLFFQLADTFAAPLQGILRGYKDTVIPFYLGLLGYWGVAIPVATLFDSLTDFGAYSYWIGLIISLIVSGALYRWRLTVIMKRFESLAKSKC